MCIRDRAYTVTDLVNGDVRRFDTVGGGGSSQEPDPDLEMAPYAVAGPNAARFSPDGSRVALVAASTTREWGGVLLLAADGSTSEVPGMVSMAGWLDDSRLLGRGASPAGADVDARVPLVVWDAGSGRTEPVGELVRPEEFGDARCDGGFWGWLLSDGTLGVSWNSPQGSNLSRYALPSGTVLAWGGVKAVQTQATSLDVAGWQQTHPIIGGSAGLIDPAPRDDGPRLVTAVEPGSVALPIMVAADALNGPEAWSLFGRSSMTLTWWWRELLVLLGLVVVVRRVIAARRRPVGDP